MVQVVLKLQFIKRIIQMSTNHLLTKTLTKSIHLPLEIDLNQTIVALAKPKILIIPFPRSHIQPAIYTVVSSP